MASRFRLRTTSCSVAALLDHRSGVPFMSAPRHRFRMALRQMGERKMEAGKRTSGTLVRWNDDRGFGFIAPDGGGPQVFLHISALPADGPRPVVNERLHFDIETDPKGALRAMRVRRSNEHARLPQGRKRTSPSRRANRSWRAALFALLGLGALGWYASQRSGDHLVAKQAAGAIPPAPALYQCDGRTHCSQMTSCAEARYFLAHCPDVKMDGNGDGEPCEQQWCK